MTWEEPAVGTYTGRYIEDIEVTQIDGRHIKYITPEGSRGGFPLPAEFTGNLSRGYLYALELHRGSTVAGVGIYRNGEIDWLIRLDDHTLWQKWRKEVDDAKSKMIAYVDEHKQDWLQRAERLPDVLKQQLNEDTMYDYIGYGYILVICELAVMYKKSGGEDTDEIMEYARREGTSGNQHSMAIAAARDLEF